MRPDMYKVIVERPRRGGRVQGEGRAFRASEERPGKIGIKRGYARKKWLNENLAPLKRWLASQVNRPWDKVYAELSEGIDRRNTVQDHIYTHIDDFVALRTEIRDGEIYLRSYPWRGGLQPLRTSRIGLYVHPVTGLLLANGHRTGSRQRRLVQRAEAAAERAASRRILDARTQLHLLDRGWFEIEIGELPEHGFCWDAVRKTYVSSKRDWERNEALFGGWRHYAVRKRQLSKAELRRYGLEAPHDNGARGRRCCLSRRLARAPMQ